MCFLASLISWSIHMQVCVNYLPSNLFIRIYQNLFVTQPHHFKYLQYNAGQSGIINVAKIILLFLIYQEHFIARIQPFFIEKRGEIFLQVRLPVRGKGILYFSLVLFYMPFTDGSQPKNTGSKKSFRSLMYHFLKILYLR